MPRNVTLSIHKFGDDITKLSIKEAQQEGIEAIWQMMWQININTYAMRGIDITNLKMDRSICEIRKAPWAINHPNSSSGILENSDA
jgi:hypothetical protein